LLLSPGNGSTERHAFSNGFGTGLAKGAYKYKSSSIHQKNKRHTRRRRLSSSSIEKSRPGIPASRRLIISSR